MATRSFLINNTYSTMSKLFAPIMHCWSRKALVAIHWAHLGLNGICAKSFCPQKMNNRTLFFVGCFQWQRCHIECLEMTSQWRHHNNTHSWYSELNSLQNVYFQIFIFLKLTEWHRFVTYLWNDPRIYDHGVGASQCCVQPSVCLKLVLFFRFD